MGLAKPWLNFPSDEFRLTSPVHKQPPTYMPCHIHPFKIIIYSHLSISVSPHVVPHCRGPTAAGTKLCRVQPFIPGFFVRHQTAHSKNHRSNSEHSQRTYIKPDTICTARRPGKLWERVLPNVHQMKILLLLKQRR